MLGQKTNKIDVNHSWKPQPKGWCNARDKIHLMLILHQNSIISLQ